MEGGKKIKLVYMICSTTKGLFNWQTIDDSDGTSIVLDAAEPFYNS